MLNLRFLSRLIFQLSLAAYFLSHGINLTNNLDQTVQLINKNIANYVGQ